MLGYVLLLAHRGSPSTAAPENTVGAVVAAFERGADGIEVDLRLSADGVLVASHDPDLSRLTGQPSAERLRVADLPWPALRGAADARGLPLARVEDLLVAAEGRRVVLELKQPPPAPQASVRTARALGTRLRDLQRSGLVMDVTVSSFSTTLIGAVRDTWPRDLPLRTALLGRHVPAHGLLRQCLAGGHDEIHVQVLKLLEGPRVVELAHRLGVAVVPWTVNRPDHLRRITELGVDSFITDVPLSAREVVAEADPDA